MGAGLCPASILTQRSAHSLGKQRVVPQVLENIENMKEAPGFILVQLCHLQPSGEVNQ